MKLRLDKNSITIRIEPEERAELSRTGSLQERISIDQNNFFQFTVRMSDQIESVAANFTSNQLIVQLPKNQAEVWLTSGQVGIRANIISSQKNMILLVVEEDLPPRKKHTDS
jgi:HSP20 family molecular chaperone IbpA